MLTRLNDLFKIVIRSIITFLGRFVRQPPAPDGTSNSEYSFFVTGDVILYHTSPVEKQSDLKIKAELLDSKAELPDSKGESYDSQAQLLNPDDIIAEIRNQFGSVFNTGYLENKPEIRARWDDPSNIYWTVTTVAIGENNLSVVKFKATEEISAGHYVGPGLDQVENRDTLEVVRALQQGIERNKGSVESASLNWYSGAGQPRAIGTGGPSGGPVPVVRSPFYKPKVNNLTPASAPSTVKIFVLDTAPPVSAFEDASLHFPNHPILNSFFTGGHPNKQNLPLHLGGNGRLTVTYNQLAHSVSDGALMDFLKQNKIEGHDYLMYDHGTFVSGIIDSMLQKAYSGASSNSNHYSIELIQVLGNYGVGTLESIMWGLLYAWGQIVANPNISYVVNCSFALTTPRTDLVELPQSAVKTAFLRTLTQITGIADANRLVSLETLNNICNQISQNRSNVAIVAAAGNESQSGTRVKAGSPANFGSVIGVAAIDDTKQPTAYSNIADNPGDAGFAVLGGKNNAQRRTVPPIAESVTAFAVPTSINDGIAGIYIGPFPQAQSQANTKGWAWWSGTSFATPQVTSAMAILLASNVSVIDAQAALRTASLMPQTLAGEWRLDVTFYS